MRKGIVGFYKDAEQLKAAASAVRDRKIRAFDAFSPFPVHGIEEAMGLKRSFIPWVTFGAGLAGCALALLFQCWTSAVDWPINVGGKPFVSLPAFIPVTFELTVLLAGLSTAAAMFWACRLPDLKTPVLDPALTNDQFALFVSADDPGYREKELGELMKRTGSHEIRVI